jgi:hypothetical protein
MTENRKTISIGGADCLKTRSQLLTGAQAEEAKLQDTSSRKLMSNIRSSERSLDSVPEKGQPESSAVESGAGR